MPLRRSYSMTYWRTVAIVPFSRVSFNVTNLAGTLLVRIESRVVLGVGEQGPGLIRIATSSVSGLGSRVPG